jgi:hypothetical protein
MELYLHSPNTKYRDNFTFTFFSVWKVHFCQKHVLINIALSVITSGYQQVFLGENSTVTKHDSHIQSHPHPHDY